MARAVHAHQRTRPASADRTRELGLESAIAKLDKYNLIILDDIAYVSKHQADEENRSLIVIKTGPVGERALRGMRHAIVAMEEEGNNLIVDDVLLGSEKKEYADLLSPFEPYTVGVKAPLDVLEGRERERGDRLIGLARWQFDKVHQGMIYDLEVDTSSAPPLECAALVKQRFQL